MRILLDECVTVLLAKDLSPHEVATVRRLGLTGLSDGELLRRAAREFDVLLIVDQSIEHQNVVPPTLILVTVISRFIGYGSLREFVPRIIEKLETARPGEAIRITLR